jgi:ribosome maturation factor RimP
MSWQTAVERTVTGLGYDLVDCERSARGLLRVFIDRVPGQAYPTGPGEFVTVDDCEQVTYVLEVENCAYERLEVSSPGLDRPLKREADYHRFAGAEIDLMLKLPLAGRKKFRGVLQAAGEGDAGGWRLVFNDGKADQALDFSLDEVREASLVPVIDFKGRRARPTDVAPAHDAASETEDKKVDGGRTQ